MEIFQYLKLKKYKYQDNETELISALKPSLCYLRIRLQDIYSLFIKF